MNQYITEQELNQKLSESVDYIKGIIPYKKIDLAIVLGSGLSKFADEIKEGAISYEKIPNFPISSVAGHSGNLIYGKFNGKNILAAQGRVHYYEGLPMWVITYPIRLFKSINIEKLILTNAAGGINPDFKPGDFMIITDHINFLGENPLRGPNMSNLGDRFPDMTFTYDREYIKIAKKTAQEMNVNVHQGVYTATIGPSYETPAEIKMLRTIGSDAAGMSTVPEAIVGSHSKMRILAISCITNMAAGILDQPLSHDEVLETTERTNTIFVNYIKSIIKNL